MEMRLFFSFLYGLCLHHNISDGMNCALLPLMVEVFEKNWSNDVLRGNNDFLQYFDS